MLTPVDALAVALALPILASIFSQVDVAHELPSHQPHEDGPTQPQRSVTVGAPVAKDPHDRTAKLASYQFYVLKKKNRQHENLQKCTIAIHLIAISPTRRCFPFLFMFSFSFPAIPPLHVFFFFFFLEALECAGSERGSTPLARPAPKAGALDHSATLSSNRRKLASYSS